MFKHPRPAARLAPALVAIGLMSCGAPVRPPPTVTLSPASPSSPTPSPPPALTPTWTPIPGSPGSLRSAAARRGIAIGVAVDTLYLFGEPPYMNIVGREFNLLTPETEMKFDLIEAQRGQLNFVPADQIMTFAAANAMAVRGHTLVWHKSLPDWLAQGKFSRDEMITILHDYITSVVGHFKGKIAAWDVVNEAVYDDGRLRKGVWLDRIGPDYAEMAFRWAHEADPGALLFYNDYGMEELNTKSNAVYKLVKGWRAKGVPIDGVGLQMHIRADAAPRPGSMQANMERFGALGLAVQITEMDVSTSYLRGTPESRLQKQAQTVQTIANTCLSVKPCSALVVWGVTDKYTWLHSFLGPGDKPLLFDDTYQPKPAYDALLAALVGEP